MYVKALTSMVHLEKAMFTQLKNKVSLELSLFKYGIYLQYQNYAPSAAMLSV